MKVLMNGHNSVQLTPVWPVMPGYGSSPVISYDESPVPSAGANGTFQPSWREQITAVLRQPRTTVKAAPKVLTKEAPQEALRATQTAQAEAPTTPTGAVESGAPGPSGTLPGPASPAPAVHPYFTPGAGSEAGTGAEIPPVIEDTGGAGTPTLALDTETYVGGTELGPEAGNGAVVVDEEKKSRWPLYVGIGAGVLALLGVVGAVAWSGRK